MHLAREADPKVEWYHPFTPLDNRGRWERVFVIIESVLTVMEILDNKHPSVALQLTSCFVHRDIRTS
jgi:hypothetical protein